MVEHISGRLFDDEIWSKVITRLGAVTRQNAHRFYAAQRTCALRWLAVLWKQRTVRAEEFQVQLDRVCSLQDCDIVLAN